MNREESRGEVEGSDDGGNSVSRKALLPKNEGGDDVAITVADPEDAAATEARQTEKHHQKLQTIEENPNNLAMYKAAIDGDWAAAETHLRKDEKLGWIEITEQGDRALHLAVSGNHTEFVRRLIALVGWEMLELYDGNGYTACCYAAMAGNVELVRIMMDANPFIANIQNGFGTTPFTLAISYGNPKIVFYFLRLIEIKGLKEEEWFNLFLLAIARKMFDVALLILDINKNLAVLRRKDGDGRTALHVLAQQDISSGLETRDDRKRQADLCLELAKKLWDHIQELGMTRALELIDHPPILHDAAKVGNLYLIDMIAFDYPHLLANLDQDGNSLSHIIVTNRHTNMLQLVKHARNVKNFNAVSLDEDGNNLLHLAAKSLHPNGLDSDADQDIEMRSAFTWFKGVEAVVPPIYGKMTNQKGETPMALFWKEHAKLSAQTEAYVKKTAKSGMLISTIVMTLVFAAAFSPPGGFDQFTGIPILLKKKWFTSFVALKVLALTSSTISIIGFWLIISSKTKEYKYLLLPYYLRISMSALLLSVMFIISAFLCAFFSVFVQDKRLLAMLLILPFYTFFGLVIFYYIVKVLRNQA